MKINFSDKSKNYWFGKTYFSFPSLSEFKKYFFDGLDIELIYTENTNNTNSDKDIDGTLYFIQDDNNFTDNKLNVMLCVENCYYWNHYMHYNKYKNYNNNKIKIYFYNHIDKIEKTNNYISIPVIYLQMNFLQKYYHENKPSIQTPFDKKKNCLIATSLNNQDKKNISNILYFLFNTCDFISNKKDIIGNKSCYNDIELLNLFNQYKFVFVSENSIMDGYITEKIFNCFLSRTIPIYYGSKKIDYFFNKKAFINLNNYKNSSDYIKLIKNIDNENTYNEIINTKIINDEYNDENYKNITNEFIKKNI